MGRRCFKKQLPYHTLPSLRDSLSAPPGGACALWPPPLSLVPCHLWAFWGGRGWSVVYMSSFIFACLNWHSCIQMLTAYLTYSPGIPGMSPNRQPYSDVREHWTALQNPNKVNVWCLGSAVALCQMHSHALVAVKSISSWIPACLPLFWPDGFSFPCCCLMGCLVERSGKRGRLDTCTGSLHGAALEGNLETAANTKCCSLYVARQSNFLNRPL